MNKFTLSVFDLIINSAESLRNKMNDTLLRYRNDMKKVTDEAGRYKAETEFIASKKNVLTGIARQEIDRAQRVFGNAIAQYIEQLRKELRKHVSEPLNASFRDQALTIAQFGIQPSETQIRALLESNSGNPIGLAVIEKLLTDVKSPYKLNYRKIENYEDDLAIIAELGVQPVCYDPDFHHETAEILSGQPIKMIRDDGTVYESGSVFDSITLLTASSSFEVALDKIREMKSGWGADVTYRTASSTSGIGEAESSKDKVLSSTTLEEGDDQVAIEIARKLGTEKREKVNPYVK